MLGGVEVGAGLRANGSELMARKGPLSVVPELNELRRRPRDTGARHQGARIGHSLHPLDVHGDIREWSWPTWPCRGWLRKSLQARLLPRPRGRETRLGLKSLQVLGPLQPTQSKISTVST